MLLYNKTGEVIGELYDRPAKVEMKIGKKGLALIKKSESFRSEPYLCPAGIPTIGYGSTMYNDGSKVSLDDTAITKAFATKMLQYQCDTIYGAAVNDNTIIMNIQNHFDAMTSFTYNVGIGGLKASTLLKRHNKGDFSGASKEFGKWIYSDGVVLKGLITRRKREMALYLT